MGTGKASKSSFMNKIHASSAAQKVDFLILGSGGRALLGAPRRKTFLCNKRLHESVVVKLMFKWQMALNDTRTVEQY